MDIFDKPEEIGPYIITPPGEQYDEYWAVHKNLSQVEVMCADRDACLMLIGIDMAGSWGDILELRQRFNYGPPSLSATTAHLVQYFEDGE